MAVDLVRRVAMEFNLPATNQEGDEMFKRKLIPVIFGDAEPASIVGCCFDNLGAYQDGNGYNIIHLPTGMFVMRTRLLQAARRAMSFVQKDGALFGFDLGRVGEMPPRDLLRTWLPTFEQARREYGGMF